MCRSPSRTVFPGRCSQGSDVPRCGSTLKALGSKLILHFKLFLGVFSIILFNLLQAPRWQAELKDGHPAPDVVSLTAMKTGLMLVSANRLRLRSLGFGSSLLFQGCRTATAVSSKLVAAVRLNRLQCLFFHLQDEIHVDLWRRHSKTGSSFLRQPQ